jgi:uncharacterized membrane protein
MGHAVNVDDPERVIAALNRSRHIRVFAVVAGLILVLGILLTATGAMYSADPAARVVNTPAK